jgi:hypothetical protein
MWILEMRVWVLLRGFIPLELNTTGGRSDNPWNASTTVWENETCTLHGTSSCYCTLINLKSMLVKAISHANYSYNFFKSIHMLNISQSHTADTDIIV